jgi:hypothetical protein
VKDRLPSSIPKVRFDVSRAVNEFCHLSVLFAEMMPLELANGVLGNKKYQDEHADLRSNDVQAELEKNRELKSQREWFDFARILMRQDRDVEPGVLVDGGLCAEMFRRIQTIGGAGFQQTWSEAAQRLEDYRKKFEALWSPIGDQVLSRLSDLAKVDWRTREIRVHFIDCLYGGFAWDDCVGVTPVQDLEVEMKLVSHELSELITPQGMVALHARRAGLDPGVTHTVVDLVAYFSVKDFLPKPDVLGQEKKGVKPNPNYYPAVQELFPVFEKYAESPTIYPTFRTVLEDMIAAIRK